MTRDDALSMLDEALGKDAGSTRGDEALADLGWNSLASVSLLALADERGLELEPKAIARCRTAAELLALLGV